jgi:hypothetical protein
MMNSSKLTSCKARQRGGEGRRGAEEWQWRGQSRGQGRERKGRGVRETARAYVGEIHLARVDLENVAACLLIRRRKFDLAINAPRADERRV